MQCTICLSDEGDVLQKGCHCRGDAGAVHVECLIELAKHSNDSDAWQHCQVCRVSFRGPMVRALAVPRLALAKAKKSESESAMMEYLSAAGHYAQTLPYSDPEAEAIYRQVQAARSLLLGPDHWLTLWSGHNVAHTLANQGRYSEAIPVLLGIIEAMERTGRENDALTARGTLARAYCDGGRRGEALECQLQVCEQIDRTKHPDHPRAIENKGLLVAIYTEVGQLDRAFELAEDLLPRQRRVFGESHASTLMMQMQMTNLLMKQRKYPEAEALARRTHDLYHATRGPEHANTISAAGWAAHFAMLNGRVEDAERALAAVVVRAERVTTAFSRLNMLSFFASHGLALTRCGRHQEGVAMLRDTHAEQVANPEQGPDHPSSLRTARSLGEALVGAGEVHEGKALLEETLAAQTRVLGPNVYDTEETATQLAKAEAALAGSPAV